MRWILLATIALLVAPTVAGLTAEWDSPAGQLNPDMESKPGTLTVTATCNEVWERTPPASTSFLEVYVQHTKTAVGMTIAGPGTMILDTSECIAPSEETIQVETEFEFQVGRNALGLTPLEFTSSVQLEGGELGEPVSATDSGTVQSAYYPAFTATVEHPIETTPEGEDHEFIIELENFGNANALIGFELSEQPPEGVLVLLPPSQILATPLGEGKSTGTASVIVRYDSEDVGFINELAAINLIITNQAADDPSQEGESRSMSLLLRVRDTKGAPASGPILAVGTLAIAAVTARRRA